MTKGLGFIAAILVALVAAALVLRPLLGRSQPQSVLGEWTANGSTAPGSASYKYGTVSKATRLGFGTDGRELIVGWVQVPHHSRPLPIETIGQYLIHGPTLVQSVKAGNNPFSSLGLAVSRSASAITLTSNYEVQGHQLTLSQPQTGKSITFSLTAVAIPPSRSGAGPAMGH